MHKVGAVVAQLASLSLNDTTTVVNADEAYVFDAFSQDEGMVTGSHEAVVIKGIGAADEHSAFHQFDGDIGFHVDASRQVTPHPETQGATTLFRNPVNGELYATGVHRYAITADAKLRGIVDGFLAFGKGMAETQQKGDKES